MTINFASDNVTGAAPEILEALARANVGTAMPYGDDEATARLGARFADLFETEVAVFPVATGTAANALALSALVPAYGAIYCHRDSHINVDECGAPEFYSGGAKLVVLEGADCKITPQAIEAAVTGAGVVHNVQPAAISISQASEAGSLYQPEEVAAIAELARRHGLGLHMDGARFANAVAALGCSPAEASWKAGIDVLSFGATKNGALAAEAVLLFGPKLTGAQSRSDFGYRRKRAGHLFSKMRFLTAQLEAYLEDGLWLTSAHRANAMAARLANGLAGLPGVALKHPVEANEIFARGPGAMIQGLLDAGFEFYHWGPEGEVQVRLVTAWNTTEAEVDGFLTAAGRLAEASRRKSA